MTPPDIRPGSAIDVLREFDATFSVRLVGGPYDGQIVTGEFLGSTVRCWGRSGEADYRIEFRLPPVIPAIAYFVEREGPEPKSGP